jgi:hypothetical protein
MARLDISRISAILAPMRLSKQKLIDLGWTPEKLRGRLQACRKDMRDMREGRYFANGATESAKWQYRYLLICIYLGYKQDLEILLK